MRPLVETRGAASTDQLTDEMKNRKGPNKKGAIMRRSALPTLDAENPAGGDLATRGSFRARNYLDSFRVLRHD
jgi:hypothetical protein